MDVEGKIKNEKEKEKERDATRQLCFLYIGWRGTVIVRTKARDPQPLTLVIQQPLLRVAKIG